MPDSYYRLGLLLLAAAGAIISVPFIGDPVILFRVAVGIVLCMLFAGAEALVCYYKKDISNGR